MAPARRQRAVTLLEMLLVVALVGILAGIAYPSYRAHVLRANRLEAIEALLAAAAAQERFYLTHGRYADRFAPPGEAGLSLPSVTDRGRYVLTIETAEPGAFRMSAVPRPSSGQEGDSRCREIWIRSDGRRGSLDHHGNDTTPTCWG